MPHYTQLKQKVRIVLSHTWICKERGPNNRIQHWDARHSGFTFGDKKGVTLVTLMNWLTGVVTDPDIKSLERLAEFISDHLAIPGHEIDGKRDGKFHPSDMSDEVSVEGLCIIIGYDEDERVQKEYASIFMALGPHRAYVYKNAKQAQEALSHLLGLYHVFRPQKIGGRSLIVRMGLAVLAPVPISDKKKERVVAIVSKLSIPTVQQGGQPYIYTGAISDKQELTAWHYVQDQNQRKDFAFLLTDRGDLERSDRQRLGAMLTRGQTGAWAKPVAYDIVVRKTTDVVVSADIDAFLNNSAVLDPPNIDGLPEIFFPGKKWPNPDSD